MEDSAANETREVPEHRFDDDDDVEMADEAAEKNDVKEDDVEEEEQPEDEDEIIPAAQLPSSQPPGTQLPSSQPLEADSGSMLTRRYRRIVLEHGAPASEAREWLARVLVDGPRAVAEILAIVVAPAAGDEGAVAAEQLVNQQMVMQNRPGDSVRTLCDLLAPDAIDASPELVTSRKARAAFQDFWTRVARECSDAILYDTDCFDTVLTWLEALSTARISLLRYAACLAAYSIVDGLIALGARLRSRLVSLQRQLATERKRCTRGMVGKRGRPSKTAPSIRLSAKGKALEKQVHDLSANNGELIELADKVFTGIFVLKYRDIAPEIRVASVQYLGKWIMRHPDHYLDDTHSKYIGWLLSDKDPLVRRSCIAALSDMLQQPDFFQSLELFLRRFLSRIVEMCQDKDHDVSVRAIRLCGLMIPYDILDQESVDQLCDQVLEESNGTIRKAAGHFLMLLIAENEEDSATGSKHTKKGKETKTKRKQVGLLNSELPIPETAKDHIRELILIVSREDAADVHTELVHDAMWDVMLALRSWDAYVSLLAEGQTEGNTSKKKKARKEEEPLTENEKALVCELLVESAKRVAKESPRTKKTSDNETAEDALARIFAPLIPRLIVQFQGNTRALSALVQLPKYFSDSHFETVMQREHFVNLLNRLVDAIARHTGSVDVIQSSVDTLHAMNEESHPLREQTSEALVKACVAASKDLHQYVAAGVKESDHVGIGAALLKTRALSKVKELPDGTLADVLAVLNAITEKDMPIVFNTTIAIDACHTAVLQWVWVALRARSVSMASRHDPDFVTECEEQTKNMWKTRDELLTTLAKFAEHPFNLRVRVVSATSLLSVLCSANGFSENLPKPSSSDESAKNKPSDMPVDMCMMAVKECVLDLIVSQWGFSLRHPRVSSRYDDKKGADALVSEIDVHALCIALAQLSIRPAIPVCYLCLPFYGFLLNRNRGVRSVENIFKTSLERVLKEQKDLQLHALQALKDVAEIVIGPHESKHQAVSLLSRAIMETAPCKDYEEFFSEILKGLLLVCKHSIDDAVNLRNSISILAKANAFLAGRAGEDNASEILVDLRDLETAISNGNEIDVNDKEELKQMVFPVVKVLETISSGGQAVAPPSLKVKRGIRRGTKVAKRAKARDEDDWNSMPRTVANGSQELRRSSRHRKPIKSYTDQEPEEFEDDEEEEEEEVEQSDAEENEEEDHSQIENEQENADETEEAEEGADENEAGSGPGKLRNLETPEYESKGSRTKSGNTAKDGVSPYPVKRRRGRSKRTKSKPRKSNGHSAVSASSQTSSRPSRRSSRRRSYADVTANGSDDGADKSGEDRVEETEDLSADVDNTNENVAENVNEEDADEESNDKDHESAVLSSRAKSKRRARESTGVVSDVPVVRRKRQRKW